VETLRLEGIMPAAYDYGWLRPRVLVEVSLLARQLLALCFCASCIRRAAGAGIDVERVRLTVVEAIAAEIDHPSGSGRADRAAALVADAELHALVVQHEQASIELARAAVSRIDAGRAPRVSTIVWTPYSSLLGDAQRPLLAELLGAVDQVLVFPAGDEGHARTVAELAAASTRRVGLATFVAPIHLGALAGMTSPPGDEAERIEQELRASTTFAVEEVNIYNYGLIRDRDLQALLTAIAATLP